MTTADGGDARLRRLLDVDGRVLRWPKKARDKTLCLRHLAARFEPGRDYTEREVNAAIIAGTVEGDPALLRRELCVRGLMTRTVDGGRYRRVEAS